MEKISCKNLQHFNHKETATVCLKLNWSLLCGNLASLRITQDLKILWIKLLIAQSCMPPAVHQLSAGCSDQQDPGGRPCRLVRQCSQQHISSRALSCCLVVPSLKGFQWRKHNIVEWHENSSCFHIGGCGNQWKMIFTLESICRRPLLEPLEYKWKEYNWNFACCHLNLFTTDTLAKNQNVSVSLSNNVHTKAVHLHTLLAVWVRSHAVVASMLRCRAGAGSGSGLCPSSTSHRAGGPGAPATPTSMHLTETEVLSKHWSKKLGLVVLCYTSKNTLKQYSGFRNVIHFAGAKGHLHL